MSARIGLLLVLVGFCFLSAYCRAVPQHWSAHYFIGFPDGVVLYLGFLLASSPLVNSALVNRYHLGRLLSLVLFTVNSSIVYDLSRFLCPRPPFWEDNYALKVILLLLWFSELLSPFRNDPCKRMLYPKPGQFVSALGQARVIIYPAVILIFLECLAFAMDIAGSFGRNRWSVDLITDFDHNRVFLMYTWLMSLQCVCLPWKQARWLSVVMLFLFLATFLFSSEPQPMR